MPSILELVNAKALSTYWQETVSNRIPYLGETLFPAKKKLGLDLAWIKGYNGLPVALKPSAFDTKATTRDRIGVKKIETEMPFFREAMTIKERDRQELLRFRENDNMGLYQSIISTIFDDRKNLIEGALIQSERMRMQLLTTGGISIKANGLDYTYNYDVDGQWKANNYKELVGTSLWTDVEHATPLTDIQEMQQKVVDITGTKPTRLIMTQKVMNLLLRNKSIRLWMNPLANGQNMIRESDVRSLFASELGITIAVYDKKFKDEEGATKAFYPDNMITLIPEMTVGNTYYGTTPEEADLQSAEFNGDVEVVETGIAVTTINIPHPVNKETIVSEIVLPSFEHMSEVATIKVSA
jgi:hypothetical protein